MIINAQSGSGFMAYIKVTYPRGSCSCSRDGMVLSHSGGGTATFEVNKKGVWTVEIKSGSVVKSKTVQISTKDETQSLSMDYTTLVYNAGTQHYSMTYSSTRGTAPSFGSSAISISWNDRTPGATMVYTKNKINVDGFNKLSMNYSNLCNITYGDYSYCQLALVSSASVNTNGSLNNAAASTGKSVYSTNDLGTYSGTFTLDISSLTGEYYVAFSLGRGIRYDNQVDRKTSVSVSKIVLE